MPISMSIKLLTSSLVLGTMAGGSVGIFNLTNKRNLSQTMKTQENLKEIKKEKGEILHIASEIKDEDVETPQLDKNDEKVNSQKSIFPKLKEVVKEIKLIEKFENDNLDLSEQLKSEEKLDLEIKEREDQKILLETVWIRKDEGITLKHKSCTLLRRDKNREIPNIMNASDEKDDTCDDYETVWSDRKQLVDNQDGLWIRGEGKAVRDVVNENWDDLLVASGFTNNRNEKKKDLPSSDDQLKRLEEAGFCKIIKEGDNEEWIEISCEKK